jgi:hypothetical protein
MLEKCSQLKKRINGKEIRGYQFNKEELIIYLKTKYNLDRNDDEDVIFDEEPDLDFID